MDDDDDDEAGDDSDSGGGGSKAPRGAGVGRKPRLARAKTVSYKEAALSDDDDDDGPRLRVD